MGWAMGHQGQWHCLRRPQLVDYLDWRLGTLLFVDWYLVRLQHHHRNSHTSYDHHDCREW